MSLVIRYRNAARTAPRQTKVRREPGLPFVGCSGPTASRKNGYGDAGFTIVAEMGIRALSLSSSIASNLERRWTQVADSLHPSTAEPGTRWILR